MVGFTVKGTGDFLCFCGHEWLDHGMAVEMAGGPCTVEDCDCHGFRGVDEDGPMEVRQVTRSNGGPIMEQMKPGTRCECRDYDCAKDALYSEEAPRHEWAGAIHGKAPQCWKSADRLVTVRDASGNVHPACVTVTGSDHVTGIVGIPMCAPCAAFHEARGRDETGIHCDCGKPKRRAAIACDQCLGHDARQGLKP